MANTFFGLNIGVQGIYASQAGMTTTSHNIANTETEGFCRQIVEQQADRALRTNASYGMLGAGVQVTGIVQRRDEYYDIKYRSNSAMSGEYGTKQYYMSEIESYFNEIQLEGFNTTFDSFYNSIQELSKNPADLSTRSQMTNYAEAMCDYFNSLSNSLTQIQNEANFEVRNQVERVNSLAYQITELTQQINSSEVLSGGQTANDLRDQRALLVDELSEIVEVEVREVPVGTGTGNSSYTIRINDQLLVDTYSYNTLTCVPREHKLTQTDVEGLYDVVWTSTQQRLNVSSAYYSGTLSSLYDVMDGNDKLAFKGMAEAASGDATVILTSDFDYMNSVSTLTLPPEGELTIGNRAYQYDGFQVSVNDEGKFEYEFNLVDEVITDTEDVLVSTDPITGYTYNATIGSDIAYKGIPYYMKKMNEFLRTFAETFNDIHKSGVDLDGEAGLDFFNATDAVTGRNYVFTGDTWPNGESDNVLFDSKTGYYYMEDEEENYGSYYFMTAGNFCVTGALTENPSKLAAASEIVNGVENADIIKKLLAIKDDVELFKQGDPSSFLQTLVAEIGIDGKKAERFAENQTDILEAVKNQRLSVSGVDNDEEAMNLIKYQQAFELNSKVISVMNEVYDKLINYMGV